MTDSASVKQQLREKLAKRQIEKLKEGKQQMNVGLLKPHPLNVKLYGDPQDNSQEWRELVTSIRRKGVLEPLLVTETGLVVAGHRRLKAALAVGRAEVPVVVVPSVSELDIEEMLIHANRQRAKTKEQRIREYIELKRIEAARAKRRMVAGKKQDPRTDLSEGQGKASDLAAKKIGMAPTTAEKGIAVINAIDAAKANGDTATAAALRLALEKSVSAAYRQVVSPPAPKDSSRQSPAGKAIPDLPGLQQKWKSSGLFALWAKAPKEARKQFIAYLLRGDGAAQPKG